MKAKLVERDRIPVGDDEVVEIVVWIVPAPVRGSSHTYKYRLAYVVEEKCVLRYDNEAGKGDHVHFAGAEQAYEFTTLNQLLRDFWRDVERLST